MPQGSRYGKLERHHTDLFTLSRWSNCHECLFSVCCATFATPKAACPKKRIQEAGRHFRAGHCPVTLRLYGPSRVTSLIGRCRSAATAQPPKES